MSYKIKLGQGKTVVVEDGDEAGMLVAGKRAERNALLAESDCYVLADFPISSSDLAKWKTYRQELRGMDFSDPEKIVFPIKPE